MLTSSPLSKRGRLYVACVVVAGTFAIGESLYQLYVTQIPYAWIILALLTLFSGSFAIRVPSIPATISVSETFVFTAVLLFGTAPGTLIVALDGLIISLWRKKRHLHRILFNGSEPAISIWIASHLFFWLAGIAPLSQGPVKIAPLVVPLVIFTVVYFLLNSWLTAFAVWLETGLSAARVWRQHFLWLSLNYFGGASVAILLARNTSGVDYSALSLIVPLLIISYLTYKTALQRVEDARSHVTELNKLYLSTIETFAMWIDAKDQVTHGHIRRVQTFAVELARDLGLKDERLLQAIEAAALLHDMGKLAVPEHILNKPGRLTSGEFEKMKLHASVGAQILSSIDFPYPVVPIVRHHHENWDGTGYPDRLAGTDIPIGARVLSVVDCFDALTSDRPYRPRLEDSEAIRILLDRRGKMYDPLVVDAFMRVHTQFSQRGDLSPDADEAVLARSPKAVPEGFTPTDLSGNSEGVLALYELARSLAGHAGLGDTADVIVRHLKDLVPSTLYVLFLYDGETDEVVAVHASGSRAEGVCGRRIHAGTCVSGWVAAQKRTTTDADARLELAKLGLPCSEGLARAHSAPLVDDGSLVGVITLYSGDPLSPERTRVLDLLVPQVSRALARAVEFDRDQAARLKDSLTGLPRFATVAQLISSPQSAAGGPHPLVVVFLDINRLKSINQRFGTPVGDAVLMHVTTIIRNQLRSADLLLRYDGDEFVVLFTDSDTSTAERVAVRLVDSVSSSSFILGDGTNLPIELTSGYAIAPADGVSLDELVRVARGRAFGASPRVESRVVH
jgi:diguanylate cyclase (GGDEF)-like protein/putative nucleotidyltransferase with HDIG domain